MTRAIRRDVLRMLAAAPWLGGAVLQRPARAAGAQARALQAFPLAEVRLLEGPYRRAQVLDSR